MYYLFLYSIIHVLFEISFTAFWHIFHSPKTIRRYYRGLNFYPIFQSSCLNEFCLVSPIDHLVWNNSDSKFYFLTFSASFLCYAPESHAVFDQLLLIHRYSWPDTIFFMEILSLSFSIIYFFLLSSIKGHKFTKFVF